MDLLEFENSQDYTENLGIGVISCISWIFEYTLQRGTGSAKTGGYGLTRHTREMSQRCKGHHNKSLDGCLGQLVQTQEDQES